MVSFFSGCEEGFGPSTQKIMFTYNPSSKLCGSFILLTFRSQNALCNQVNVCRFISSKTMRHRLPSSSLKPAPFPYKEKNYNFFRALFDPTTSRLDDNSKIIVVEGLPTAGKGALAKRLANELDMLYIPSPTVVCINLELLIVNYCCHYIFVFSHYFRLQHT